MSRQNLTLWVLSALLLAWIGAMWFLNGRCLEAGQRFNLRAWACEATGPPIILQRDLQRG
jgi:hypothetical protein